MLLGAIRNYALTFLSHTVLLPVGKIPPAVLDSLVNARLAFSKSFDGQRHRPSRFPIFVRVEIDPERRCRDIVARNPATDHLARLLTNARRGVAHMGWKDVMGNARCRHIFDPGSFFDAELRRLPSNR